MCLDRVLSRNPEPRGRGWKVFRQVRKYKRGNPYPATVPNKFWSGVMRSHDPYDPYEVGVWYDANPTHKAEGGSVPVIHSNYRDASFNEETYEVGFHVALDRADAEKFVDKYPSPDEIIREVEYDDATVLGEGDPAFFGGRQVVAQRMRILPDSETSK